MNNFRIIAIEVDTKTTGYIKKILNQKWYLFNSSYKVEDDTLVKNKNYPLPNDFFAENITINALVGKNGSGKTSVINIIIMLINNLSVRLLSSVQRGAS